ncbi:MAG: HAMP domain-containing protein, partial [Spirochaetaceae bacterium]|nr:HAMP domain-containing protein [Spirochaetaceae bacterium]
MVVLPLIIAPLVLAALVSYLSARNGITAVASDFLHFKSQTLSDYMDGQWSLLTDNNLDNNDEYVAAARGAVNTFAGSLVRSSSELIFAVDSQGKVVMTSGPQSPDSESYPELVNNPPPAGGEWNDTIMLNNQRRVAYIDTFPAWGWTIFVTEAWDGFYKPVTRIAYLIAIIGAVSLSIALIFLFIATGLIAKPLEGMVKAIESIMETMDLKTRVPILYKDETGRLAHSFNLMTESLDKANKDVKDFALRAVFAQRKAVLAKKETENLNILFRKYVPQSVIDMNIQRVGQELLVGENQFVSILMSDIRSFTSITEKMAPQELVDSLNRYFGKMVDVIDHHGGMTDKYIGDAIMALFGAPEKKDDDVLHSVLAGIDMLNALDDFNKEQETRGIRPFLIGIGIHYGGVTAGNIGSEKKMDYTVIGEPVNMAARLEGLTKYYGVP